ncbi:hypothetical protein SNEBB_001559 [Seison nebaliae]|nr:hypothetical protein SNEBB_001559 [Seison nebaliae]
MFRKCFRNPIQQLFSLIIFLLTLPLLCLHQIYDNLKNLVYGRWRRDEALVEVTRKPVIPFYRLIMLNCIICGVEFTVSGVFAFAPPLLLKSGINESRIGIILGLGPFICLAVMPYISRISDRLGKRKPFIIGFSLLLMISLACMPWIEMWIAQVLKKFDLYDEILMQQQPQTYQQSSFGPNPRAFHTSTLNTPKSLEIPSIIKKNGIDINNSNFINHLLHPKNTSNLHDITQLIEKNNNSLIKPSSTQQLLKQRNISSFHQHKHSSVNQYLIYYLSYLPTFGLIFMIVIFDFTSEALLTPCEALISELTRGTAQHHSSFIIYSTMMSIGGCIGYYVSSVHWTLLVVPSTRKKNRHIINKNNKSFVNIIQNTKEFLQNTTQERAVIGLLLVLFTITFSLTMSSATELRRRKSFYRHRNKSKRRQLLANGKKNSSRNDQIIPFDSPCPSCTDDDSEEESSSEMFDDSDDEDSTDFHNEKKKELFNSTTSMQHFENGRKKNLKKPKTFLRRIIPIYFVYFFRAPYVLRKLAYTDFFSWAGLMCWNFFYTDWIGRRLFLGNPNELISERSHQRYDTGIRSGSHGLLLHCIVSAIYALSVPQLIRRYGTRRIYSLGVLSFILSMIFMLCVVHFSQDLQLLQTPIYFTNENYQPLAQQIKKSWKINHSLIQIMDDMKGSLKPSNFNNSTILANLFDIRTYSNIIQHEIYMVHLMSSFTGFLFATLTVIPFTLVSTFHLKKKLFYQDKPRHSNGVSLDMAILDGAWYSSQIVLTLSLSTVLSFFHSIDIFIIVAALFGACAYISSLGLITSASEIQKHYHL